MINYLLMVASFVAGFVFAILVVYVYYLAIRVDIKENQK